MLFYYIYYASYPALITTEIVLVRILSPKWPKVSGTVNLQIVFEGMRPVQRQVVVRPQAGSTLAAR